MTGWLKKLFSISFRWANSPVIPCFSRHRAQPRRAAFLSGRRVAAVETRRRFRNVTQCQRRFRAGKRWRLPGRRFVVARSELAL